MMDTPADFTDDVVVRATMGLLDEVGLIGVVEAPPAATVLGFMGDVVEVEGALKEPVAAFCFRGMRVILFLPPSANGLPPDTFFG